MDDRNKEIITRFCNSWTETKNFYKSLVDNYPGFERSKFVIELIDRWKLQGMDSYFRIGTSMHDLLISRSVNHGLRNDQKYIKIEVYDSSFLITFRDGEKNFKQYSVESLDDDRLDKLLITLKHTLVD